MSGVNLVVALSCEARPIIERYRLRPLAEQTPFPIYCDAEQQLQLIVSGVGRSAAACAVGFLAGRATSSAAAWLDVGTAGHRELALGSVRLAHKIEDRLAQRSLYPQLVFDPPCPTATVCTVDRAVDDYPDDALYEMEASGFFSGATRFSTAELVSVLKVVSDNAAHPSSELGPQQLAARIAQALEPLDSVLCALSELSAELAGRSADPPLLSELTARFRLSVTRRHQLRALLERAVALEDERALAPRLLATRTARDLLATLRAAVGESS